MQNPHSAQHIGLNLLATLWPLVPYHKIWKFFESFGYEMAMKSLKYMTLSEFITLYSAFQWPLNQMSDIEREKISPDKVGHY